MRIAWLGPEPSLESGVPYAASQILLGLVEAGAEVDAFINPVTAPYDDHFYGRLGLRVFETKVRWEWGRWYSRDPLAATATALVARSRAQITLVGTLCEKHATAPYDVIYQFSQFEVPWLRGRSGLPPVVVHPEVHAAGELRWQRRERQLAIRCGGLARAEATTAMFVARALIQRRHSRMVSAFIAPSRMFARQLASDYGISAERLHVVANPIDTERYRPVGQGPARRAPLEVLFVSRMSVRKGVEMIVALTHRLAAEPGAFHVRVVGTGALFSDYRPLLQSLNLDVATYEGTLNAAELAALYRNVDIVVQPSHYEPFALTVGEALASGTPVVVSDAVGAGEDLPTECCRTFPAGDLDGFEREVRAMAKTLSTPERRAAVRSRARKEAERRFAPAVVCGELLDVLGNVVELASTEP